MGDPKTPHPILMGATIASRYFVIPQVLMLLSNRHHYLIDTTKANATRCIVWKWEV